MPISPFQFQMMAARTAQSRKNSKLKIQTAEDVAFDVPIAGAELEIRDIHKPIIDWCKNQVPTVPYINSRPDLASTIGEGVQDFTIFYKGQALCIECKSRTGKPDEHQRDWAHLMAAQGFVVHIVRSFQQFLELVNQ